MNLTQSAINEICKADIADPRKQNLNYDGTRALDGGEELFEQGLKMEVKQKTKMLCYKRKFQTISLPYSIHRRA